MLFGALGATFLSPALPAPPPSVPAGPLVRARAAAPRAPARHVALRQKMTLLGDAFSGSSTAPNAWAAVGDACLTAGNGSTPATSVPACGASAPQDAPGQGALQLTTGSGFQSGMVVAMSPVATAGGLQITFVDYAFNGTTPGADGMTLFLSDASQPMPLVIGGPAGSLGYANGSSNNTPVAGVANAYVGIALDEFGNFSNPTEGRLGGPGFIAETLAVRGAAASGYQYLGGFSSGQQPASLPFALDQPSAQTRPNGAPTIQVVITPLGAISAAIDRHDGNGFVPYYSQNIVGVNGQPPLPATVYVGLTATTDSNDNRHQIGGFSIASLAAGPSDFVPTQIPNLTAWFDASATGGVTQNNGRVAAWNDLSGNGNSVGQPSAALQPAFLAAGINTLGSLAFGGKAYLAGTNASFSAQIFNESSVFVVTNQTNSAQPGSVAWSGAYLADPRWNLHLSAAGPLTFDFNNKQAGRLSSGVVASGPALWTALGSVSTKSQLLRKDGNALSSSGGPGLSAGQKYPLVVGATASGMKVSSQFNGQLGEMLIFNRMLAPGEATQVEGYLACKWGLQNRLPANHPYRNVCPQGGTYPSLPIPGPKPNALLDPPQLRSVNGQLVFNVVASANSLTGNPQLTYDGSPVPPTLRLLPGDTLIVNLTNALPTPPPGSGYLNDTNLHYHGLHVSPNAPGDDSIDMLAMPGQSLHYQVVIPQNHPAGLYWYHSHAHGEAERQNLSGMSGALIVDGIAGTVPQVANLPERIIVVRDALLPGEVLPPADSKQVRAMLWAMKHATRSTPAMRGMATMRMDAPVRGNTTAKTRNPFVVVDGTYRRFKRPALDQHCQPGSPEAAVKNWTVNGQTTPSIGIRPGERQFWRLVNAASDTYLDAQVDNTQMQIVALDGVPLATPMTVGHYVIPPASRAEFIVAGPPAGKTAYLRTNCFDAGPSGPAMPAAMLASIDPHSSPSDAYRHRERRIERARVQRPNHGAAYIRAFLKRHAIARTQTLTYSDQNTINGQTYDPSGPAQFYAQSGTMEQWQIVNNSGQVHTFHIHQMHFLVQSIVGGAPIEQQNVNQVIDNIDVPAATANGPGSVTVVLDFTDPALIGTFLLHCHILSHEDAGMMAKISVGTSPPLTTGAPPQGLTFASPGAPAQTVTIAGGQPPYSVGGCSGVANASITGASLTVSPVAGGSCVLTVADSGGLSASLAVAVQGLPSPIVLTPNSLGFVSPGAPAQTSSIAGGTAPYAITGCQGVASEIIVASLVTVSPVAVGACASTVTDAANNTQTLSVSVNGQSGGNAIDNLTFHQSASRQGWYRAETALTTSNVASRAFGILGRLGAPAGMPAFGKVYAQPLYVSSENVGGIVHNLVIVATATDQVYAFDDATRTVVWERSFTNPAQGITQQSWTDTSCADVNPDIGITGTPVIDRAADLLYVVVPTKESGVFHQRLHAISLQNGGDALAPAEVSASVQLATGGVASTDARWNYNRSALLEANGNVYVALGSHCDFNAGATHGWVLAYTAASLQPAGNAIDLTNSNTGGSYYLGSSWMGGFGTAADVQGNLYFATGNGPWDGISNFSMSVLKVPGDLNLTGSTYFTPATEAQDSNNDQDLGSGGVMLLPDGLSSGYPHLAVAGGKKGASGAQKYILNRDNLGGMQPGDAGAVWHADTGGAIWGGPAFFQDASGNSYVIYGTGSPLNTYLINPATAALSVYASANVGCLECRDSGSQPVVSSNGSAAGSTVAWALHTPGNGGGAIVLYAFDALTMHTLYSGTAGTWLATPGAAYIGGALVSPVVANGKVYVPTDGSVAIFGLQGSLRVPRSPVGRAAQGKAR